jgi:hypothetical protein
MKAKSINERQRDHYNKMNTAGMKKVCVYVPDDQVKQLRECAEMFRQSRIQNYL